MDISIIVPVYNEAGNLWQAYRAIKTIMEEREGGFEIIFIDDGSVDGSFSILDDIARTDCRVRVIRFDKNYGKTSALHAGFSCAQGIYILTIDSDLQIGAQDLLKLLEGLKTHEVVLGRRRNRRNIDGFIKAASSLTGNFVRNVILGESFYDAGCSLRGFRKHCILDLQLFRDFDTFIPSIMRQRGFSIMEIDIQIRPRTYGISKYKISNRAWKLLWGLFVFKWMNTNRLKYVTYNTACF